MRTKIDPIMVGDLKAKRVNIEKHEPTMLPALNLICHNEEARARGYDESVLYSVGWLQRIFAQLFTFPWFSPRQLNQRTRFGFRLERRPSNAAQT
jgi:hypothetical protein